MVVSAWASTVFPSFDWGDNILRWFWVGLSFVSTVPCESFLRKGLRQSSLVWHYSRWFRLKFGRGNSSSWPIGCPLICNLLVVMLLSGVSRLIVAVKICFIGEDFPSKPPTLSKQFGKLHWQFSSEFAPSLADWGFRRWTRDELFTLRGIDIDLAADWRGCFTVWIPAIGKRWTVAIATVAATSAAWFLSDEKEMNRRHSNCCFFWMAETEFYNWKFTTGCQQHSHPWITFRQVGWKTLRFPLRISAQLRRDWSETGSCQQIKYFCSSQAFVVVEFIGRWSIFRESWSWSYLGR